MTTLFVYGDSFAAPCQVGKDFKSWPEIVANNLGLDIRNRAVAGSSTEYAMKKFVEDVNNDLFKPKDLIIFVTSTPGRFHFRFQCDRPETASQYWNAVDVTDPKHLWYKINKRHVIWAMDNIDLHMAEVNHECYLHTLKDFASTRPDCKILVLANSNHNTSIPSTIPFGKTTSNFLRPNIFLQTISANEFNGFDTYNEFVRHTTWDPRVNHLSIINSDTLIEMVITAFQKNNVTHFNYDNFESKIFKPIIGTKEYLGYVSRGYLYRRPDIEANLPDNLT